MRKSSTAAVPFISALIVFALGCIDAPTEPTSPASLVSVRDVTGTRSAIRFETLVPGDAVAVHFESIGCFHHIVADLVLTRNELGANLTLVRASGNRLPSEHITTAGSIDLQMIRGLDHVLEFYRTDRPSTCTTTDRTTFRVLSGALRGVEETYTDGSCGTQEDPRYYPVAGLFHFTHDSAARGAT
jgi:hypothetical protein